MILLMGSVWATTKKPRMYPKPVIRYMIFTKPSLTANPWIFSSSLTAVPRMSSPLFVSPARSIFWSKWRSIRSSDRWNFWRFMGQSRCCFFGSLIGRLAFAGCNVSGQIIATSHDLTPNGRLVRGIPLCQGNLGWWNIMILQECVRLKILVLKTKLGVVVSYVFYSHFENWGRWIQFDEHICFFSDGLKI